MIDPKKGQRSVEFLKDATRGFRDELISQEEDMESMRVREDQLERFGEDVSMGDDGTILGPNGEPLIRPY